MIIAVSDVHIGYSESDSLEFARFLGDDLWEKNRITDLVLCGDIFDMWRGSIVDVMIEGSGIVRGLKHLHWKYGINITFIAGNHDYLIRNSRVKPFKFNTFKTLEEGGVKYTFIHGWEDDSIQNSAFFDALCYTDNPTGEFIGDAWQNYLRYQSYLTRLWESLFGLKSREQMGVMIEPPGERDLGWLFGSYDQGPTQMTGDVTVLGHTHTPGINGNVVNCGSWCSDSPVHNTYVVIDGDTVEIRRYGDD
jgi:UDP-2,3-diacylglucosamine pyrophosphatase LpxH